MKLTKKLIPALGMLVLSACMLVTSTFAWFSMNESVKATGMSVTAKGDQVYLQIVSGTSNAAFVNGSSTQTIATATTGTAELLPTNVKADKSTWGEYAGGKTFVWAKATGTAPNDYNKVGTYSEATPGDDYYLMNSFMIRLDPTAGAANASAPLNVSEVKFTDAYTANDLGETVCVLVVCGNNSQLYTQATPGTFTAVTASNDYLDATAVSDGAGGTVDVFANQTGVQVDIYVFFNGDNAKCTLEKLAAANQAGTNNYPIEVSFTCKKAA